MSEGFERCLAHVLAHEGGYVDHPLDRGGATNMGITRKALAHWRGVVPFTQLPKAAVRALTRAEAAAIYEANYWRVCRAGEMPAGVDLAVFDYAVDSGPSRAIKALQVCLAVPADGMIGPVTLGALARARPRLLINALCDQRMGFLGKLGTFVTFGKGWTRRVSLVRTAALGMAGENQTSTQLEGLPMLDGYKTYIVSTIMLLVGLAQLLGIDLPAFDQASVGNLIIVALAFVFLRKSVKGVLAQS
ncbi:glycoside hydrolase family 108 protein [Devosia sp. MC521]|uniref:glycoside hydrolase family 108 protein n=1 Tax=Devosia sp. MC521 TaxID=2759954 RepID=UPI0015FD2682|nr:glycoside hydrolase family 108 protein [Devosia sp. MC521]MBJ6987311.1 glycoside hydrolase family 108 protein [Devosia sp. MC521]QMW63488.1 glycoside hydrolase family 108 protein [Devosia sp. MC521]